MDEFLSSLKPILDRHEVLNSVVAAGVDVARELRHPFLDSFHCFVGLARTVPRSPVLECGLPRIALDELDRRVRRVVQVGDLGTQPRGVSPLAEYMLYAILVDCAVIGARNPSDFHVLMFFLSRPNSATSLYEPPGYDPRTQMEGVIKSYRPDLLRELTFYYCETAKLLAIAKNYRMTRPKVIN